MINLKLVSQVVAAGVPGPVGKSAYQIAVDNGFEGTEYEWLRELHPFKGWFDDVSELEAVHANPLVGEYAYVKGATSSDPVKIYECSTEGSWSDSGRTVDTSTVQTFGSGEAVNEVDITDDSSDIEENSDKIPTAGAVAEALGNNEFSTGEKIKEVGIDDEPTAGSDNLVKSGGVNIKFGIPIDLIEGSIILYDGTKYTQSGFGVSNPIFLKKDCIVTITCRVLNVSTISLTNEQGTVFTRVAGTPSGGTASMKTYTYTAIEDCYVAVSGSMSSSSNIYYTDTLLFDKDKGIANGVTPLNNDSKVDKNYLPDIEEQDLPSLTQLVTNACTGKKELNYSIVGKYILYNPDNPSQNAHLIDGTQNAVTTPPIFLRKSEIIQVKCGGKGFATIALTDATASQYTIIAGTKSLDPTPENPVTYSYTAVEDCYVASSVALTSFDEENSYIRGAKDFIPTEEKGTANGIAPLDENAKLDEEYLPDRLQDLMDKVKIPIDFSELGYTILYDEQVKSQQSGFGISEVIQLTKGNLITINTRGSNICTICLTNSEGTTFTRVAGTPSGQPADAKTYSYIATEDCYVMVCGTISSAKDMYYTIDTSVAESLTTKNIEHVVTIELESGTFNQDTGEPLYADLTIKPLINYFVYEIT